MDKDGRQTREGIGAEGHWRGRVSHFSRDFTSVVTRSLGSDGEERMEEGEFGVFQTE